MAARKRIAAVEPSDLGWKLSEAGFTITEVDVFYAKDGPNFAGVMSLGVATA